MTSGSEPAVLSAAYLARPSPVVAPRLLGQPLCRCLPDGTVIRARIHEVEAYDGVADAACHARFGETPRNRVMFGPPGAWYVYLCYGVHWLLNIVTGPPGHPSAVLIRGAGSWRGPGRLTRGLQIDGSLNKQFAGPACGLWIEQTRQRAVPSRLRSATPRVGIDYAPPVWRDKPWRFVLEP
ncbi:MAG: DNA-3-methyladenine glycosylase [Opitutales bacterium]